MRVGGRVLAALAAISIVGLVWSSSAVAYTTTRTVYGNTGTVTQASAVLWSGIVRAGEQAQALVQGTLADSTYNGDMSLGWVCGQQRFGRDHWRARVVYWGSATSAATLLQWTGTDRYCTITLEQTDAVGRWTISDVQVTLTYDSSLVPPLEPPVTPPSIAPTDSPNASPTGPPSGSPSPSPCVSFVPQPSGQYGPPAPTGCPSPTPPPSITCDPQGYASSTVRTFGGAEGACLADIATGVIYHSGFDLQINMHAPRTSSHGGTSKVFDTYVINGVPDQSVLDGLPVGTGVGFNSTGDCDPVCYSDRRPLSGDSTDGVSETVDGFPITVTLVSDVSDLSLYVISEDGGASWFSAGAYLAIQGTTDPSPSPLPSPSGSPSASPGSSGGSGSCSTFIGPPAPGSSCDVSGGLGGIGVPGGGLGGNNPGPGQCVPGPLSGICKPGLGIYGQGGDCPFPAGSWNPLDYFGWIGCLIANLPTAIANAFQWFLNAILDLLQPDPVQLADDIGALYAKLLTKAPFGWFADIIGGLSDALSIGGSRPDPTLAIAGVTIHLGDALDSAAGAVSPYRGMMVAAVYLFGAIRVVQLVLGAVGQNPTGGSDDG